MFSLNGDLKHANVLSMTMDEYGNTWVGTVNGLVVHTAKNKLIVLSNKNTIYLQENDNEMIAVLEQEQITRLRKLFKQVIHFLPHPYFGNQMKLFRYLSRVFTKTMFG